ncbi:DUF1329 domain-containing protein [Pseudomonas guariconensis]|uniref:DUF1329 domain-containing protein n=1 Tax=Pseudomonas guariconensis TaxID=1288410 RepID=UPI003AF324C2
MRTCMVVLGMLVVMGAQAAGQLPEELTPVGAERGASADGRIPAWQGGLASSQQRLGSNGTPLDPYADEQPLYRITAHNYLQYQDQLSAGQIALLKRFPDSLDLPVYPTHRSVAVPREVAVSAAHNAGRVRLSDDGNGLQGFSGVIAFPQPSNGLEVIWNHLTRSRNASYSLVCDSVTPQKNGRFVLMSARQDFARPESLQGKAADNILYYFTYRMTAPSRLAGDAMVVHETLDQVAEPRLSWVYSASQRRVRRAPALAYDTTGPGTAGLRTADSRDMFNGAPDRYDWTLVGKKALHVPYNSYRLASPSLRYRELIQPGHVNPQPTRYELHRVWVVEATLKPGAQHVYAKRRYYIDEDTWAILEADLYDRNGTLWRTSQAHSFYHPVGEAVVNAMEVTYDLKSGRYHVSGLTNEQRQPFVFNLRTSVSFFSPGALRSFGVR